MTDVGRWRNERFQIFIDNFRYYDRPKSVGITNKKKIIKVFGNLGI